MGPKICPSTPVMVNKGVNAAMVMTVENNTELSTWMALMKMVRKRVVQPMAGSVKVAPGPVAMTRKS